MLKDYLGDAVLEFDIKGGFAHLLSIYGLARETAAITRMRLKSEKLPDLSKLNLPKQPSSPAETSEVDFLKLRIENPDLCPRYSALLVRGITIGPSPFWMQQRPLLHPEGRGTDGDPANQEGTVSWTKVRILNSQLQEIHF